MQPLLIDDILHGQTAEMAAWVAESAGHAIPNMPLLAFGALGASGKPAIGAVWCCQDGSADIEVMLAATAEATPELWAQVWRYPFYDLSLARVTTQVDASNAAAVALTQAQGFAVEAVKKHADGKGGDVLHMGLLREECRLLPALSPAEKVFREERAAASPPVAAPDPVRTPREVPKGVPVTAGVINGGLGTDVNAGLAMWVSHHFDGRPVAMDARAFGFTDPENLAEIIGGCIFWDFREGRDIRVTAAADDAAGIPESAIREVLKFPFGELKVPRVTAEIDMSNVRALRAADRIGFRNEGIKRRASASGGNMGLFGLYR